MTERREQKRIPVRINAGLSIGKRFYTAEILNLSGSGMLIRANFNVRRGEPITVFLSTSKEIPKLEAELSRIGRKDGTCQEIGVKLIDPPRKYTDFVENLSYYQYL